MNQYAAHGIGSRPDEGSIDERIVDLLQIHGPQSLDILSDVFCEEGWAQVFLAIDRLSRAERVLVGPPCNGDYIVSASWTPKEASASKSGSGSRPLRTPTACLVPSDS
ncbi:MAG: hypothetical protein AB7G68_19965 [Nitrospiraceae bacterium]